jgi:hypothetical protein
MIDLANLRYGFSCREDDEAEAFGAELMRLAAAIRKQRAAGQTGLAGGNNESDTGTP